MSNVRIAALVVAVLMASLSIPHVSLLNFGVEDGYAIIDGVNDCQTCLANPDPAVWCDGGNSGSYCEYYATGCAAGYTSRLTCPSTPTGSISISFTVNGQTQVTVNRGDIIRLNWQVVGATSVSATGFTVGNKEFEGDLELRAESSTSYTLRGTSTSGSVVSKIVTVTVTGTNTGNNRQCCVIGNPDGTATYTTTDNEVACGAKNGRYSPSSCTTLETAQCSQFCLTQDPPRSPGTCQAGAANPSLFRYSNVCASGVCQCGQINTQLQRRTEACSSACLTGSQFSGSYSPYYSSQSLTQFPVGQCTNNPQSLFMFANIATQSGAAGATSTRQPYRVGNRGENQCDADEECWCVFYGLDSFSANSNNRLPATIPGTSGTPRWTPPDLIENPPQKPAGERLCEFAVNATMTASFGSAAIGNGTTATATSGSLKLIKAGDSVTIVGKVTKLTDQCAGYNYTCRVQKEVNCKLDSGFRIFPPSFRNELEYQGCPADIPNQIHKEGEWSGTNWRRTLAVACAVGGTVAAFYTAGQTAPAAAQCAAIAAGSGCGQEQIDGLVTTGLQLALRQTTQSTRNNNPATTPGTNSACTKSCSNGLPCQIDSDCDNFGGGVCSCNNPDPVGGTQRTGTGLSDRHICPSDFGIDGVCQASCAPGDIGSGSCDDGSKCCIPQPQFGFAVADPTFDITGNAAAGNDITGQAFTTLGGSPTAGPGSFGTAAKSGGFNYASLYSLAPVLVSLFPACPPPEKVLGCFSVCGKPYNVPPSYAPSCNRGGDVIGFDEAAYRCGMGDCGGFSGKEVRIRILGPTGAVAIDDSTAADADGAFSYTFRAPAGDGEFKAIVSVDNG